MPKKKLKLELENFILEPDAPYWFKNDFSAKRGRGKHCAIDMFGRRGDIILCPISGLIVQVFYEGEDRGGNGILIKVDGYDDTYLYMVHLDECYRVENTRINALDMVGTMGNSGNSKQNRCHCHTQAYNLYGKGKRKKSFINLYSELKKLADPKMKSKSKCKKDPGQCEWCN